MSLELRNFTPFVPFAFEKEGKARTAYDVVILKGTFDLLPDQVKVAKIQRLPEMADRYHGEPETSSLAMEGDLVIGKVSTDIFVTGSARPLNAIAVPEWLAQIEIGNEGRDGIKGGVKHTLHLSGPRTWQRGLVGGWTLTEPIPASEIALKYELAYGGTIARPCKKTPDCPDGMRVDVYAHNPVGVGYYDSAQMERGSTYPAPQIKHYGDKLKSPHFADNKKQQPAGTTPLSRWWPERYRYAGTYDDKWHRTWQDAQGNPQPGVFPGLPDDFDYRFYSAAPQGLTYPGFMQGSEAIALKGLLPQGHLSTRLTGVRFEAVLQGGPESGRIEKLKLDTVHIDLDAQQVILTWRLTIPTAIGAERVQLMFGLLEQAG
jgi:hypothetical protein